MTKTILITILTLSVLLSCKDQREKEISKIKLEYDFIEFHKDFFLANEEKLLVLKKKFPYLFPSALTNKEWLDKINDPDEQILFKITDSVYPNLKIIHDQTDKLYKYIKYYNPTFSPPKTFTLINGLDYETPIIYADSLAFISLDMFLGADSEVYNNFPKYISSNFTQDNIIVDLAKKIIQKEYVIHRDQSFIGSMIYFGKQLYLAELFLPDVKENLILGIPQSKLTWSIENESEIWKYFISHEMLFSTNQSLNKRFIDLAPFSKFYLGNDRESPGGIGNFIGLQIVRSYMKNNSVSIDKMIKTNTDILFKNSKYKPTK
ncbi:gliding motility lipoprotein GldB [Flavicella sp.]|uniref:gliding motility lipoprotein GldB n=1 Tax=Flavicella sp. TaxID=2957742 RepID=UPI003018BAE7